MLAASAVAQTSFGAESTRLPPAVLDELSKVAAVYSMIQTDYITPVDGVGVMSSCMKGMFKILDSQSTYLDKEALEDFQGASLPDLAGIGVELTMRSGLPTVVAANEGSAAERAGLRPKDYIVEIDGQSMEEIELRDAMRLLRGQPGSTVSLVIRRPGEFVNRSIKLTRQFAAFKPISGQRVSFDIGYLRVREIRESTAPEIRAEFRKLQGARPLRGLVLDLRNSPGGLLGSSIELAAMFLPSEAPIVSTVGRLPEANQAFTANRDTIMKWRGSLKDPWPDAMKAIPLVVLVNGGTASGAEIIAAALRDNARATLVGSKTFGRGNIQTVRQLSKDSAIKLTTAYYKTPNGDQLQGNGLAPDVQSPDLDRIEDAGSDGDLGLRKAIELLRTKP